MHILFPTRSAYAGAYARPVPMGTPDRARPCRCHVPFPDDEGGCVCGHWLESVIDQTWRDQAVRLRLNERHAGVGATGLLAVG